MTAPPQDDWSSEQVVAWFEPGFQRLESVYAECVDGTPRWDRSCEDFLHALDVHDRAELVHRPELRALCLFVESLERDLGSDEDRWAVLLSEGERRRTVVEAHGRWMRELAETSDVVQDQPEPTWVEGHGWMRYDHTIGEWVYIEDPDGALAQAAPTWVEGHGWMRYDRTIGEWVHVENPDEGA